MICDLCLKNHNESCFAGPQGLPIGSPGPHNQRMVARRVLAVWVCLAAVVLLAEDKTFQRPRTFPAQTYPAHDDNKLAKVAVAADPYDLADKQAIFPHVKFADAEFLPLNLVITNDGDRAVSLVDMKVELVTARKTRLLPAEPEDIYRRITHVKSVANEPTRSPIPLPRTKGTKGGLKQETRDEIEGSRFLAHAVEPHASQAGFVFFDIEGVRDPLAGAKLYVSGLRDADGNELMFFEIPLEKYLTYQPGK